MTHTDATVYLGQMVLHDVTNDAKRVEIATTALQIQIFLEKKEQRKSQIHGHVTGRQGKRRTESCTLKVMVTDAM